MSNPFSAPERDRLFRRIGMPWYNLCPISSSGVPITDEQKPYALYHAHAVSPQLIQDLNHAAKRVGRIFAQLRSTIQQLDSETLIDYGFPQETIRVIRSEALAPFCMRLDWCWNEEKNVRKVLEANVQTPSFWFECVEGNAQVAQHFGLNAPELNLPNRLKTSLNQQIDRAASLSRKSVDQVQIAFTALNNAEDMGTMRWLSEFVSQEVLVFPLEYLKIKNGDGLFYEKTGERIDVLFMWYPVEWTIHDTDENNQKLWPALEELILKKRVTIVNFASAFALQPKSIFALITDLGLDFFDPIDALTVFDFFPKTAQTVESMGNTYFAKPVLGRQGEGCFAMTSGEISAQSSNQDPWYTDQDYVYQALLDLPTIDIAGRSMTALWSTWLYNDGRNQFVPGGVGLRVSEGRITDDYSYWCPIGIDANR